MDVFGVLDEYFSKLIAQIGWNVHKIFRCHIFRVVIHNVTEDIQGIADGVQILAGRKKQKLCTSLGCKTL